ncbi:tail fiber domain-containing protein [Pseudomonas sp. P8_241]|uniref:tail fiber domain-containing protein n=1 Tax=Pseudomonas sp. P8_241 TaxID=3043445 RepID=UPI002A36D9DD|nr:tail fiber domain-containing protein [Pseudomonas sp. P8_241]WPN45922.1 tail fiber domain-containing protein [Pseudomonas sp. P8_241]
MADQTQRLEIATVKAEIGSDIISRFSHDAVGADPIPTDSGDIQNLKQVIVSIQEEGAEKISFATTIYPTTAAGIAGTTDGAIFLVRSADPDEIYAVYSNTAGVAEDTGKRALSAAAIQAAMDAALESANAAEDSADLATARVAPFLGTFSAEPIARNDGAALQLGDRYFNSEEDLEYIYKASEWEPNNLDGALLAAPDGSNVVGVQQAGVGAAIRTGQDKFRESVTPQDYLAVGDGATNDSSKFTALEVVHTGKEVDLLGKTYLVNAFPTGNKYYGGYFKIGAVTHPAMWKMVRDGNGVVCIGGAGGSIPPSYQPPANQFAYHSSIFAAGVGALALATGAQQTIAIGPDAIGTAQKSFDNLAMGECALYSLQPVTDSYSTVAIAGTRNVGLGGNAGRSLTTGRANVLVGRNTGASLVNCDTVLAMGANALSGEVLSGWYAQVENFDPNTNVATQIVALGSDAAKSYTGIVLVANGYRAGFNLRKGNNNVICGALAGQFLENLSGFGGKVKSDYPSDPYVTYSKIGSVITVTAPGHAAVVGGRANIYWAGGGPAYAGHGHGFPVDVLSVSGDNFTVYCPYNGDGSGNARLYWTTSLVDAPLSQNKLINGSQAASDTTTCNNSTVSGAYAAKTVTSISNSAISGSNSCENAVGPLVGVTTHGYRALLNNSGPTINTTAIGYQAGLVMIDGSTPSVSVSNSTLLGANTRVSGPNQVQGGDSATNFYVYGTVQNRSDERDKAEIRETLLGLDFILDLKPIDFKWDMRDDYIELELDPVTGEEISVVKPRDGSKVRSRFHQGFRAQDVERTIQTKGIDFGGFQHHAVKGGAT